MSKIGIEGLGEHPLEEAARVRHHLAHWHPASTAPYNWDLELRVADGDTVATLPFPCRQTNGDEWINADLGTPLRIRPVAWRPWHGSKSPHPYPMIHRGVGGISASPPGAMG